MIFVTVGTGQFQFDRLLQAIDKAIANKNIADDVIAQIGSSVFKPQLFKYEKFMDFDRMVKLIKESEIVISHAGVGSLMLCLTLDKIPILFPRRKCFGELPDDHQLEFLKKIEDLKLALIAYSEEELVHKIKNYKKLIGGIRSLDFRKRCGKLTVYLRKICSTASSIL